MKTTGRIKFGAATIVMAALLLAFGGRILPGYHGVRAAFAAEKAPSSTAIAHSVAPAAMPLGLPSVDTAKAVLDHNPKASDSEIREALGGVLCRCFTHTRMLRAIRKYAENKKHGSVSS